MIDSQTLSNLASYSAQLACVAGLGGAALRLLEVDSAAVRYTSWRALFAVSLALPWLQPRQVVVPTNVIGAVSSSLPAADGVIGGTAAAAAAGLLTWPDAVAALLVGGIVARLAWTAMGLVRLRRLRTAGTVVVQDDGYDELQRIVRTRAELRYVPDLGQPVTFGVRRPVILLPQSLREKSSPIRSAVLCHELLHVKRRDWLWAVCEEIVRAVLWFHPAMWWLISRVQLAREEVVDELSVLATGGRRRAYLEALMAYADGSSTAPATALAKRRSLFRRIVMLSREAVMSSNRVVASCAVTVMVVVAGTHYAVGAFPLTRTTEQSHRLARAIGRLQPAAQQRSSAVQVPGPGSQPGPLERTAKPITPENPIPRRTYSVMPTLPSGAPADTRSVVALRLTIDQTGRVAEVRALRVTGAARGASAPIVTPGDPRLATAALVSAAAEAARQWMYEPPAAGPIAIDVTMAFSPGASEAQLLSHGPAVTAIGGVMAGGRAGSRGGAAASSAPPPPPPSPPPPSNQGGQQAVSSCAGAVRVGGAVLIPTRTRNVDPVYPPLAAAARVQGVVIIDGCIDPDGHVSSTRVLRSIPLLDQSAVDAVQQWEYTPTMLNGVPVPVLMTMTVNFTLQ